MRIRILSEVEQANLPGIRSWFNVDRENTVGSLKLNLCASVPALHDAHVYPNELVLTLDDFELLDDSPIHILRDGDLICLRRRTHLVKRRAETAEDAPRKRIRPLPGANGTTGGLAVGGVGINGLAFQAPARLGRGRSTESSSSSSSSNTSSDSSSDDTSSNSDSTSESSSSDSDSDSTGPSTSHDIIKVNRPLRRPSPSFEAQRKASQPRPVLVPPGFGKPQTHKRNERRRKQRLADHGSSVVSPVPAGGSNAITLGVANSGHTPKPMMMSLKNKNKRREFKNTIGLPSRITFQDSDVAPNPPQVLIPPSERDQLPPRLFVTSVDVEEDKWSRDSGQTWDRKQKKMQRESYGQAVDEADVALDYGRTSEEDSKASVSMLNYTALENAWVDAPPLEEKVALSIGCVVGWQELGINPTTVTPEMMLFLARVVSDGESGAVVIRLHRPGLGMASFAGEDLKDEEVEFSWDKILEMRWRLVSK